jgi:predicted nucleic acid-binding protein
MENKNVVVDTNILFSALHSDSPSVRKILNNKSFNFFSPNFIFRELFKYKEKMLKNSKLSETEMEEVLGILLQKLNFINENHISLANWIEAYKLCHQIDEKDTPFVALSLELDAELWTRDQELKNGLLTKGFIHFFDEKAYSSD